MLTVCYCLGPKQVCIQSTPGKWQCLAATSAWFCLCCLQGLGRQLDVKSKTFQADLHAFLQRNFQNAPYHFARQRLTESAVYPDIMCNISEAARSA